MSDPAKAPSLYTQVTGEPSTLSPSHASLNPSSGHFHNQTVYRIEEAVLPLTFARVCHKKQRVLATRTVVKILILSFKVRAAPRSPEALTFVPVFLTEEGDVLEPSTCEIVGRYDLDNLELNPGFVHRYEYGKNKVRNVHIKFDLSTQDLDFSSNLFDTGATAYPDPSASALRGMSPLSRKVATKHPPGKHLPPLGNSSPARKKPREEPRTAAMKTNPPKEDVHDVDTDSDSEIKEWVGLFNGILGFDCDQPSVPPGSPCSPGLSPPRVARKKADPSTFSHGGKPAPPQG